MSFANSSLFTDRFSLRPQGALLRLVANNPGHATPFFQASLIATAERTVATLVAAGAIEHLGSRKTNDLWPKSITTNFH